MQNKIKKLRKQRGITLQQLSEELEKNGFSISPDVLSKYEREEREPKLVTWQKLADYFDVNVAYLQGLTNTSKPFRKHSHTKPTGKLYRIKNPITGRYYCKSADTIATQTPREEAIVYTEETAKKLLHDANVTWDILAKYQNGPSQPFPGYELEPVLLQDIRLIPEWKNIIQKDAVQYNLTVEKATALFRKQLVKFWSQWANYNGPFDGQEMPTMPSPMEKLIVEDEKE